MEGLIAHVGYSVVSVVLLWLVLVAVRLLPCISTAIITFALLQFVLPNMALFNGEESVRNDFVFIMLAISAILGTILDIGSIVKRSYHFWDISSTMFGKD